MTTKENQTAEMAKNEDKTVENSFDQITLVVQGMKSSKYVWCGKGNIYIYIYIIYLVINTL